MIRAICLNPVIDRMYYIDGFAAGRQYKEQVPSRFVGGKGVNIARVAALLGEQCTLYGFVGGANGALVEEDMERHGVRFVAFHTPGETRTTINIIDRAGRRETEITEPGAPVGPAGQTAFLAALERDVEPGDMVICSGIPMRGMDQDIYRRVALLAEAKRARCVLDANSCYLKASFPGRYFFSKPNFGELCELHGVQTTQSAAAALELGQKTLAMGVENLMVSMGREGCLFLNGQLALRAEVPDEPVSSTIGSGDSTVAGFCVACQRGLDYPQAVRFAMACGVCNAQSAQVGYVERGRVEELVGRIALSPV